MILHWNHLRASLIAEFFGIDIPESQANWQTWIDSLDEDDALKLRGSLIQKFGRPDLEAPPHDSKVYTQAHMTRLEIEFSIWLCRPREIIDYVLASRHQGLDASCRGWHWLPAHQEMWSYRGRRTDEEPLGIRLLPFVETSLERIVSRHLGAAMAEFFREVGKRPKEAEEWIVYVESGCAHLHRSIPELLGDSLVAFQALQNRQQGAHISPHESCRYALRDLKRLKADLPRSIHKSYQAILDDLEQILESYRPQPAQPVAPDRRTNVLNGDIYEENAHFLNNWD